jgi:two-component system, OmpR family, response regulator RegX3
MKIDLLEDDPDQAALLRVWLESEGHTVRWYRSGADLTRALHRDVPDVLLLDWVLPESSGMDVLTWVRQSFLGQLPVIFITAQDREDQVVMALEAGADDYLVKPARRRELMARIQAIGRRSGLSQQGQQALAGTEPFMFDVPSRSATVEGRRVELTSKEFDLDVWSPVALYLSASGAGIPKPYRPARSMRISAGYAKSWSWMSGTAGG